MDRSLSRRKLSARWSYNEEHWMENKTEQNCLISVIVPVYNILDCLERCVNSICGQTWKNLEILLVDDGSTDGTGKLCDLLCRKR